MALYKFKKNAEIVTSDFWYDLFSGGYIKPEELLEDPAQAEIVRSAINTLQVFKDNAEDQNVLIES